MKHNARHINANHSQRRACITPTKAFTCAGRHSLPYYSLYLEILYRSESALASANYRKPPFRWKRLPKRDYSQHCSPPLEKKKTPANENSGFSPTLFQMRRSRDRSHASLWLCDLQERGVTRVHHSLIISSPLLCCSGLGSAGSCHVMTGSFIAMRMVSLRFHHQGINMLDCGVGVNNAQDCALRLNGLIRIQRSPW